MSRSRTGGVMAIVIVAAIIAMFIFGALFMIGITADLDPADVAGTALEDTTPVVTSILGVFHGLMPIFLGLGLLALVIVAAVVLYRSSKRRR